ncbi:MAG: hypothetical protein E6K10_02105 [Methanobacteriota archaeon]|nr:MAG: hypothetical protein E6K10_02105 [Euryarchaeota archaeon]
MTLWEISFRAQYDYPFIRMSGRYPGLPISMWCVFNRELLQVPTLDPRILEGIERDIAKAGRVVDKWVEGAEARIFMLQKCTCDALDSPWNVWEKFDFVDAPPAVYKDGWGYFRVIGFDESKTRDLFREMNTRGPTELIRKRELSLSVLPSSVWVNSLFAELTEKQMDAVLKAHRHGYYTSPRQITTESIAKGIGLSRSTYEEHLRKAENRIMGALIPYMQLFASGEKKPEKMLAKGSVLEAAESAAQGSA